MKVLLVNPSWTSYVSRKGRRINRLWPPLDLLNCAAMLKQEGVKADIIDARAEGSNPERLAQAAALYDKVFVTSSPLDRWQCPNLDLDVFWNELAGLKHDELYLMGVHGTHYPKMMLEHIGAKAVIMGEPEWTVAEICRGAALDSVKGLARRDGDAIIVSKPRALGRLSEMPTPAFELLNLNRYRYELLGERFVLLEATRGCPFPCTFCMRDMYGGRAWREKTPAQVARDVEAAVIGCGAQSGYFIDLEFTLKKDYVLEICRLIKPLASRWLWACQTRADSVDAELLREMKAAGCALIHFGVETGSERVMRQIDKRITHEQIKQGVSLAARAGIETACFFMLGFPGETDAEREETLAFAMRLNPTYASFHVASPYPGTPLYAAGNWGELYPETAAEDALGAQRLKQWEKKAYRRYYLRPGFALSFARNFSPRRAVKQLSLLWNMA